MRTKTPAIAKRSRSQTPDRSSRSGLFGPPSPPPPSRTYGKTKNRSRPSTPRHAASTRTSPRHSSPPIASSSTSPSHRIQSLLNYEEPVVLTPTSSCSSSSILFPTDLNLYTDTLSAPQSPQAKAQDMTMASNDDDEPVFLSMRLVPVQPKPPGGIALDGEAKQVSVLKSALQAAKNRIKALEDAAEERNMCGCCKDVMFQPFILSCGHSICKDCILRLSAVYLGARMNYACPECRTVQGRFTPIPNYSAQSSVNDMLQSQGINPPPHSPLQWPVKFQSRPMTFPFPLRNGTYPCGSALASASILTPAPALALTHASVPAPFPIAVDDDE
ncbi:hypothetical protein DFH05DRAFT_1525556 [Lentinula detonsa]|uniref:RING-type domain-containing protein n=1 Tax=Lentinula detonsa TaxID=2804962 RepID=A0A9W8TXX2_9AGAR|nr:hypothetical protein DFH05DRAFT_1525556 [Lentinula detonsa]